MIDLNNNRNLFSLQNCAFVKCVRTSVTFDLCPCLRATCRQQIFVVVVVVIIIVIDVIVVAVVQQPVSH